MIRSGREISSAGLSKGVAKTKFGSSVLGMLQSWNQASSADESVSEAHDSLTETLLTGIRHGALTPEDLAQLSVHLCKHATSSNASSKAIKEWLEKTQYFQDYCEKDPAFRATLTGGGGAGRGSTAAEMATRSTQPPEP